LTGGRKGDIFLLTSIHRWVKIKRLGIKGSEVRVAIEALKKEISYVEKTSLHFNPSAHRLPCHLLCPGKNI
jgi:hypothetical protein